MKIEFSEHALARLKSRKNITKDMVINTVQSPDHNSESFKDRIVLQKIYDDKVLEVVCKKEDNIVIVITEYFLEK